MITVSFSAESTAELCEHIANFMAESAEPVKASGKKETAKTTAPKANAPAKFEPAPTPKKAAITKDMLVEAWSEQKLKYGLESSVLIAINQKYGAKNLSALAESDYEAVLADIMAITGKTFNPED